MERFGGARGDAHRRVVGGQRVLAGGAGAGRRESARHVRAVAPRRPGQRPAPPLRQAPRRGGRRSGRRPPRGRTGGTARGRPGGDPRQAEGGARRPRPGGHGSGRRRRPALRVARGGQGAAAEPDAAGGRGRHAAPDGVRGAHGGRSDDDRADRAEARRDRRRRPGPHPQPGPVPGARGPGLRVPSAGGDPDRQVPGHGPLPAAAARSSVHAGRFDPRRRSAASGTGGGAARGRRVLRHVRHGGGARGRRDGCAAGRGDGGRRTGPHAAGRLAGDRVPSERERRTERRGGHGRRGRQGCQGRRRGW